MALCIEQNKSLMRKYFEQIWNRGDLAFIDENLASGFVSHDPVSGHHLLYVILCQGSIYECL